MLKKLTLTNFKKHRNLEIDFTEGLNVVLGPNFCGKSTLLKAIAVVRYGITAAGKKSKIVTSGEKKWKLELIEEIGGEDYTIIRTGSTARVINSKGEVQADGGSVVTSWIVDNCGADLEDFTTHTYSKQMETSTLLTLGATKMQNKVEKLANVDVVDKVIKLLSSKNSETKGKLDLLAEVDVKELEDEIAPLQQTYDRASVNYKANLSAEGELQNEYDQRMQTYSDQLEMHTNKEEMLTNIDTERKSLEYNNSSIRHLNSELSAMPEIEDKLGKLLLKLGKMNQSLISDQATAHHKDTLAKELESLVNWLDNTGSPNLILERRLDPLIECAEEAVSQVQDAVVASKENVIECQSRINVLVKAEGESECPTCHRKYEDHDEVDYKSELDNLRAELSDLNAIALGDVRHLELKEAKRDELLEEYPGEGHEQLIQDVSEKIELKEAELTILKNVPSLEDIEIMKVEIEPLEAEVSSARAIQSSRKELSEKISGCEIEIAEAQEIIAEYERKLSEMPDVALDLSAESDELDELLAGLNQAKCNTPVLLQDLNDAKLELSVMNSKLDEAKATEKKAEKLRLQQGKFTKLSKYLRSSRSRFLGTVWQGILSRATEIVSNATAGDDDQITELARSDKGEFTYFEKGVEFGMGDASGCQLEMMGVSLRLALTDLFYGHGSYMMLDEASSQMNNENAAALAGVLAATGKQIVYVTHRATEETTAKNIIQLGEVA